MKLNWFSPLLPAKTEIASYTWRILPELSKYAQIVLWTDQNSWDSKLEQYAQVEQYQHRHLNWLKINQADFNIYHIGNNPLFHSKIWEISRLCPGIVVLHDLKLFDFFGEMYKAQQQNLNSYQNNKINLAGQKEQPIIKDFTDGILSSEYMAQNHPMTNLATEGMIGIVTHNQQVYQQLSENANHLVGYVPLPHQSTNNSKSYSKSVAVRRPPYKLIVFGYIGSNRRLDSILDALATLPEKDSFHLDIYGELSNLGNVQNKISALKLNKLIKIHGFVPEKVLESALDKADLALNLRYPSMGEASASQLRIWSHALPSLVTKTGWYGTLPANTVKFVAPENEIEDIQKYLQNLLVSPQEFVELGNNGQELLNKNHTSEVYTQGLIDFIETAIEFKAYPLMEYLAKKVSEQMVYTQTNNLCPEHLNDTAQAIQDLISLD